MNPADFNIKLQTLPKKINAALDDVVIITGKHAVDLFKENFQKESFNGKA